MSTANLLSLYESGLRCAPEWNTTGSLGARCPGTVARAHLILRTTSGSNKRASYSATVNTHGFMLLSIKRHNNVTI